MANAIKVASVITKEALRILDNEPGMMNEVFRDYEGEYQKTVNGYKKGATITIRRPTDFTVTDGAVMDLQDIIEGSTTLVVDQRKHVAFQVSAQDMTLSMNDLSERVIRPATIQLKNKIEQDLFDLYKYVPSWVGSAGQVINSFTDFYKGPERLNEYAVPVEGRVAFLSPADEAGLLGAQTALYINDAAKSAYRDGSLGRLGGVGINMSQNVSAHTVGADVTTVTVNQSVVTTTIAYTDVKDSMQQTITIAGGNLNAGDVFTIDDVYAVNPVTKATLAFLKQFTVISYSSNTLVFYPAIIWTGAQKTAAITSGVTDLNTKAITAVGTAATAYRQNMVFHRNAFALATVPIEIMPGSVDGYRETFKGLSIKVQPVYDGINDVGKWRMDILYGVKAIDPRLATRLSGTS